MIKTIWKHIPGRVWMIISSILLVITIVANIVCTQVGLISNTFNNVFGYPQMEAHGDVSKYQYFKPSSAEEQYEYYDQGDGISSKEDALNAANKLNESICDEGFVLLKNEMVDNEKALPLKSDETITVLGKNSVNIMYGSSGSGGSDRSDARTLYESLDEAGIKYNTTIKSFYENKSKSGAGRQDNPGMESGVSTGIATGETSIDKYTDDVMNSFADSDTAVVVFSRIGGEGFDLPRTMWANEEKQEPVDGAYSGEDHYLELDKNEQDLLNLACENFNKVVVVINSSTPMELGFLDGIEDNDSSMDYDLSEKIQGAIWIGGTGNSGIMALGRILNGSVNPSGRLVDTYERDFSQAPSWQNFSTNFGNDRRADGGTGNSYHVDGKLSGYYYVDYEEGIYVGYRYYETRGFTDGEEWYQSQVVYPFGYGLSYTEFAWELEDEPESLELGKDDDITVRVKVTNTGDVAGKDVVELYYTPPYIAGEIEKSQVVLGGFAKTKILEPGESEVVEITFAVEEMASYDYNDANKNGFKGYELDPGDYVVSVRKNSHEVAGDSNGNSLSITYSLKDGITYETDSKSGNTVENRFDDVSEGISNVMSREDWEGTFPAAPTYEEREVDKDYIKTLKEKPLQEDTNSEKTTEEVTKTEDNPASEKNLMLYDMREVDLDDPLWDTFMDQLSDEDMALLIGTGCYSTINLDKIDKPLTMDLDGPVGFVNFLGDASVYDVCGYASECVIGATWNVGLANDLGISVGNESLIGNEAGDGKTYSGWYAPGLNLHRSPFGGRNSEYFSEDALLSGKMAAYEIKAATSMGVHAQIKHFALNEQETNRSSNGVLTWADEQTIREIYLKAFQYAVQEGEANGMMSSFNRIGTTWAGGSYALLTEILRDEWGFQGMVICDFNTGAEYMNVDQMVQAGGDLNLAQDIKPTVKGATETQKNALRTAAKNVLYVISRSNALNGHGEGVTYSYGLAKWQKVMFLIDAGIVFLLAVWGIFVIRGAKKTKLKIVKENEPK
ncbi:glycoside hydrolase family 3 C-terminal domain-containing protein [Blautia schinkii]|nr:glycoside hydrolase family 3 C-terminal domain-containing protein [Blautia schinkii]